MRARIRTYTHTHTHTHKPTHTHLPPPPRFQVFAGLLVGAMLPFWFSAMTMKSVGKAALAMVEEVRGPPPGSDSIGAGRPLGGGGGKGGWGSSRAGSSCAVLKGSRSARLECPTAALPLIPHCIPRRPLQLSTPHPTHPPLTSSPPKVRRQFNETPGLMEGTARPDYSKCVQISTDSSLREMIAPGALVMLTPVIAGT